MKILFKTIADVKEHIGWLYASASFEALRTDLELATEEIIQFIGEPLYNKAYTAYSNNSTGLLDLELIKNIQLPVALLAYRSYAENGDISHETDGRKIKIDKESESLPWEWQIVRDDAALLQKANKTTDRLIGFLDKHINDFPEWRDSEQRKDMLSLFIQNANQFNEVIPINSSRVFFIRVLPFIRSVDRDMTTYIGFGQFHDLKKAMVNEECSLEQIEIIRLCREIIPHKVMAIAVRRLALTVLPDSVVTKFTASSQTIKASTAATLEMIKAAENIYNADAGRAIIQLQTYLKKLRPDDDYKCKAVTTDYNKEKYFTV